MIADWDRLRVFHAVATAGSFTRAGADLNLSQSAISRQISALEEQLNVSLFQRHARGLVLTEQGELLARTVREILVRLLSTESQITENRDRPSGTLRVATTYGLGASWVAPLLPDFRRLYPEICLTLILDDGELDLSLREADVALRMLPPRSGGNLIRRHLMYVGLKPYAHRDYLDARGRPASLADLDQHDLLGFPHEARAPVENVNWLLEVGLPGGVQRRAVLRANSYQILLNLTRHKAGIACLPDYMAAPFPELEAVLPQEKVPSVEVFFAYTEAVRHSAKLVAFRDFLLGRVPQR